MSSDGSTPTIYWVNQFCVTPDQPGGTRHFDMASELLRRGVGVTLIASDLSLSTRSYARRRGPWDLRALRERVRHVDFVWLPAGSYRQNNWRRILSMVVFGAATSVFLATRRRLRGSVIIGSSPHLFAAFGAWMAAAVRGVPFVLEVRDLWPESYTAVSGAADGLAVSLMRRMADFLYHSSKAIVVLTEPNAGPIAARGAEPARIFLVPNGVDLEAFPAPSVRAGVGATVTFVYAGAHGPANGLDVVINACVQLREQGRDDLRVLLVGDGPAKAGLRDRIAPLQLTNVELRDPVPKAEMPALLAGVEVGLMILAPVRLFTYGVSPNKLFDYLAANLPVITNVPGVVADIVTEAKAGMVVAAGDASALAGAMVMMADDLRADPQRYRAGRAFVADHYDRRVLAVRLLEVLQKIQPAAEGRSTGTPRVG